MLCGSPGRVDEDSLSYRPVILQALGPSAITLWAHAVGPEGRRGHSDCVPALHEHPVLWVLPHQSVSQTTQAQRCSYCAHSRKWQRGLIPTHWRPAVCVRDRGMLAGMWGRCGSKANACGVTGVPRGVVGGEGHRRGSLVTSREEGSFRAGREGRTTCRVRAHDERTVQTHVAAGGGGSKGTGGEGLTVPGPSGSRGRSPRTPAGCRLNREGALVRAGGSGQKGWPAVTRPHTRHVRGHPALATVTWVPPWTPCGFPRPWSRCERVGPSRLPATTSRQASGPRAHLDLPAERKRQGTSGDDR